MIFSEEMKWLVYLMRPANVKVLRTCLKEINIPKFEKNEKDIKEFYEYFIEDVMSVFENAPDEIMDTLSHKIEWSELFFFEPDTMKKMS